MTIRIRAFLIAGTLAIASLAGCGDGPTGTPDLTSLRVNAPSILVDVNESIMLTVVGVTASGATVPVSGVTWSSLDPDVASVDQSGMVKGLAEGVARIVAASGALRDTFRISVGGRLLYNVSSRDACNTAVLRDARIVAVSDHAIIAEDLSNPAGGFSQEEYEHIAVTFDTLIYPVVTRAFGEPGDVDANERIVILYTKAVNELTPSESRSFVAGFFFSRDLFPLESRDGLQGCQTSNQAELFYMLAPDPQGEVNGNKRTREFVLGRTLATIGHEFQHLINASRRLFEANASAFETVWLNEGLSHIAEELLFYEASGLTPKRRIDVDLIRSTRGGVDAFNLYGGGNFGRLADYMKAPAEESPYERGDDIATRGATWSFLRYAADRSGRNETTLWQTLAGSSNVGFENLDAAFGTSLRRWVADWAVANGADRFGITPAAAQYRHQSWNHTEILEELELDLLDTEALTDGDSRSLTIVAGGSGHFRFRVANSPASVTAALSGSSAPSCSGRATRSLAAGAVIQGTLAELGALCLAAVEGSPQDFLLSTTYLGLSEGSTITLQLNASGLMELPLASVGRSAAGPTLSRARVLESAGDVAVEFERSLREREQRELGWRLPGGGALRPNLQTSGGGGDVVLSLLRMR